MISSCLYLSDDIWRTYHEGCSDQHGGNVPDVGFATVVQCDEVHRGVCHKLPSSLQRPLTARLKVLFGNLGCAIIPRHRFACLGEFRQKRHVARFWIDQIRHTIRVTDPDGSNDRIHDLDRIVLASLTRVVL